MKFDLRLPIGILFSLYGALLVVFGFATNSDAGLYARSLGLNINLIWGAVLLIFGVLMLVGFFLGKKNPPTL